MSIEQDHLVAAIAGNTGLKSQLASRVTGSLPSARLIQIYEHNFVSRFTDALLVTFPKTCQLLGDACFKGLAKAFIQQVPFAESSLLQFGSDFADFLQDQSVLANYQYSVDLARLEWAMEVAYNQIDQPTDQNGTWFIRSGLQLIDSDYALFDLWNYGGKVALDIRYMSQWVLVYKQDLEVMLSTVDAHQGRHVAALLAADKQTQMDVLGSLSEAQLSNLTHMGVITGVRV